MRISVVICAFTEDRWDDLKFAVESCRRQTRAPDEVIVSIDYNDRLLERSRTELVGVNVITNGLTKGLSGARNSGVEASNGDVIVFLDDDAYAEEDWLEKLVLPFEDRQVAGVGGWVIPKWGGPRPGWMPESFLWVLGCSYSGLPATGEKIRNPIGANMAIRRAVFDEVGGFSSGLGRIGRNSLGCEETELCIRYSSHSPAERFVIVHDAIVHHRVPSSRLTWKYYVTRCWAEGLSKAAVVSLAGQSRGLEAERRHAMVALPRQIFEDLKTLREDPRGALSRIGAVGVGTLAALGGYLRATFALRRQPLDVGALTY